MSEIENLLQKIRQFRDERDWMQFHSPRNLAVSISLEAAELLEHFQWITDEKTSAQVAEEKKEAITTEVADVAIYLLEFCDNLGIDLQQAIEAKLQLNAEKYPVEKARGNSLKYTELQ
jgi:NTP pyrophosphatase (non-canonical NTP hydrolase)